MWWLFNKLFGWEYILINSPALNHRYIRRVRIDASNRMYVVFSGQLLWYLLNDRTTDNGYFWSALTWDRDDPSYDRSCEVDPSNVPTAPTYE